MKICSCCKIEKPKDQYIKKSSTRDGLYVYCKDCNRIKKQKAYLKDKEAINTRKKERYLNSIKDASFLLSKRERSRLWKSRNKDKVNVGTAKRRAARKTSYIQNWGLNDELNSFAIQEIYSLSRLRSELTGIEHEVDHIIPLINDKVCGLHVYNNLQVIPAYINRSKGNKFNIA
jgi:hypothetical protein